MHLFLTSSPCLPPPEGSSRPFLLNPENGFCRLLRQSVSAPGPLLLIAADPERHDFNDRMLSDFTLVLHHAGLCSKLSWILDSRNASRLREYLSSASLVLLCGGHVPTQQHFFELLGLRTALRNYDGVVMGISAGSMNAADCVYAQPELPGEALDRDYTRFLPGLALTHISILPHLQEVRNSILDGMRLFEDITFSDSFRKPFYAFPDGSYIYEHEGKITAFGDMYRIFQGRMARICSRGESIELGGLDR